MSEQEQPSRFSATAGQQQRRRYRWNEPLSIEPCSIQHLEDHVSLMQSEIDEYQELLNSKIAQVEHARERIEYLKSIPQASAARARAWEDSNISFARTSASGTSAASSALSFSNAPQNQHIPLPTAAMRNEGEDDNWCNQQLVVDKQPETSEGVRQLNLQDTRKRPQEMVKERQFKVGHHHNTLNPLPRDWTLPTKTPLQLIQTPLQLIQTPLQLIQSWFVGDMNRNIPPLHSLNGKIIKHWNNGNKLRGKMVGFMKIVEKEARNKNVWKEDIGDWDYETVNNMWSVISDDFKAKYCQTKRRNELGWSTVYDKMSAANAFNNPRNKANKALKAMRVARGK